MEFHNSDAKTSIKFRSAVDQCKWQYDWQLAFFMQRYSNPCIVEWMFSPKHCLMLGKDLITTLHFCAETMAVRSPTVFWWALKHGSVHFSCGADDNWKICEFLKMWPSCKLELEVAKMDPYNLAISQNYVSVWFVKFHQFEIWDFSSFNSHVSDLHNSSGYIGIIVGSSLTLVFHFTL